MHSFQWIQSALGIIVALGMSRIIISATHMWIARRQVKLDWIPFVWALSIFFLLLQFSWVFVGLEGSVERWSFGLFLLLLSFVLTLFVAAALILPNSDAQAGSDLRDWHAHTGRWALPFLAFYAFLAYPFNWFMGQVPPSENPASAILIVLTMVGFFTRSRKVLATVTLVDFVLIVLVVHGMVVAES